MKHGLWVFVLVGLTGCAVNGFEKYYQPRAGSEAIQKSVWIDHSPGPVKIYTYSNDPKADVARVIEEGYVNIGTSSFYGPEKTMTRAQLLEQAKKTGAALVLIHSQYKDTQSGVVPYTVANPNVVSTVNTSGTVNAYGSGGYASGNYSGQSTITTPGGTSTYAMPYSVSRNDVVATFWVHQDPAQIRLGVNYAPLPDDLRAKLQRNTGVVATGIIRGSPAFTANVLKDDVILKIGGEDVVDPKGFDVQLSKFQGQRVQLDVLRGGEPKAISVMLNRRASN